MKKFILFLLVVTSSFSCEKIDNLLTFDFEQTTSTTIDAVLNVPGLLKVDLPIPAIKTNSSSTFANNNTKAEYVKDVKLKKLSLEITSPDDKKFSFLDEIHISISTNDDNKIELAWATNIPADANKIELTTTDKNLDVYIKNDKYDLDVEVTIKEVLLNDVDLDVDMTFQVTADPL